MGDERARAAYSNEELAWAAGFWDGEGSCGCYGKNDGRKRMASNTYLRASVNQKDREVLDRFCVAVGLGKVYGPYTTTTTQWAWQLHGDQVRLLFERLWPWLSRIKREQALAAYAKFEARGAPQKGGHVCAPDCACGRQKWKTETNVDPKIARRRQQQREATRRYREKMK